MMFSSPTPMSGPIDDVIMPHAYPAERTCAAMIRDKKVKLPPARKPDDLIH